MRRLNEFMSQFMPWQAVVFTLMARYALSRLHYLLYLNPPEIYARHYNRNFYRATWILTALDAGFWTALPVRPAIFRYPISLLLTVWYLFHAEDADIKVRKMRNIVTPQMLRVAWEKSTNPLLWHASFFARPSIGMI